MKFKNIFYLLSAIFALLTLFLTGYKPDYLFNSIDKIINKSSISKNSMVSVSIRDIKTEKIVYQRNANLLLHPASTLKAFTTPVVLNTLGESYKLSTGIYKDDRDNFYLKLSGDPMLNTEELSKLILALKAKGYNEINGDFFIDDYSIDDIPWGTGWMWDDESNPYMPKFNAYNLNRNLVTIKLKPKEQNKKPIVEISPNYGLNIINNVITSNENNVSAERKIWKTSKSVYIEGKISTPTEILFPIENPETHFKYQLSKILKDNNIKFSGSYKSEKVPQNAILITQISHNLIDEIKITNKQSDNLAAETLFKIAGKKFTGNTGSTENGLKAFKDFYTKLGLDTSEISIVDASGVSHNDLIYANWMTLALAKISKHKIFKTYKQTLATPREKGTLQNRLPEFKGKLYAKTGTNAGMSALTGYVTDKNAKVYAFSIIIQNLKGNSNPAKHLEDLILQVLK